MVDDVNVLRVGGSEPDTEEPNEEYMSRRKFIIYLAGWAASIGLLGFSLVTKLRSSKPKSIDDYINPTDAMLGTLSKVTIDDVNLLGVEYRKTNPLFKVHTIIEDPSIIQKYLITYYFAEYFFPEKENKTVTHETMTIELIYPAKIKEDEMSPIDREGRRYWSFSGEGLLDANNFSYHLHNIDWHKDKDIRFERGYGSSAITNIRQLLNIDEHIQKSKAQRRI